MSQLTSNPSDTLTALQTTYDQLLTQFFATLSYLSLRHPVVPPPADSNEPYTKYPLISNTSFEPSDSAQQQEVKQEYPQPGPEDADADKTPRPLRPDTPTTFATSQNELAEDLIVKAAQIHELIDQLPESVHGAAEQEARIRGLAEHVRDVEMKRKNARTEMRSLVQRLDNVVLGMATNVRMYAPTNATNGTDGSG